MFTANAGVNQGIRNDKRTVSARQSTVAMHFNLKILFVIEQNLCDLQAQMPPERL